MSVALASPQSIRSFPYTAAKLSIREPPLLISQCTWLGWGWAQHNPGLSIWSKSVQVGLISGISVPIFCWGANRSLFSETGSYKRHHKPGRVGPRSRACLSVNQWSGEGSKAWRSRPNIIIWIPGSHHAWSWSLDTVVIRSDNFFAQTELTFLSLAMQRSPHIWWE